MRKDSPRKQATDSTIRVRLRSYEHAALEQVVKTLTETVNNTGGKVTSIVWLPNERKVITVNKSPHIDKTSREQFQYVSHKLVLQISPNEQTREALARFKVPANLSIRLH